MPNNNDNAAGRNIQSSLLQNCTSASENFVVKKKNTSAGCQGFVLLVDRF